MARSPPSHTTRRSTPLAPRCCSQVRDGGNLLTRAGLAIPAVDVDEVAVHYRDPAQLVEHLRCARGEERAGRRPARRLHGMCIAVAVDAAALGSAPPPHLPF